MREIKFRVFKTQFTRVGEHNIGEMAYDVVLANPVWNNADIRVNDILSKTHNLMQYTGLKDKNGIEIYEGDIVKWGHTLGYGEEAWHRVAKVEFSPDLQFKILHYIDSKTLEKKPTDNYIFQFGRFSYQETHKYLEVIGNIYENPELIKDTP